MDFPGMMMSNPKQKLQVYKVQTAIFGTPSVLIYNEDRTELWEDSKPNRVKAIKDLIGNKEKAYVVGYSDDNGIIHILEVLTDKDKKYYF